jgi:hypothetical protein
MNRNLAPAGKTYRTGLRRWFDEKYKYRPGWYAIDEAIQQGMPYERHPITGRILFDLQAVSVWFEASRLAPVQQTQGTETP